MNCMFSTTLLPAWGGCVTIGLKSPWAAQPSRSFAKPVATPHAASSFCSPSARSRNDTSLLNRSSTLLTWPQLNFDDDLPNASFSSRATSRTAGSGRTCGAGNVIEQLGPPLPLANDGPPGVRGLETFPESQATTVTARTASTPNADVRSIVILR